MFAFAPCNNQSASATQAAATTALLAGREGWVPTRNVTALLLLVATPGGLQAKIGLMFKLLDRCVRGFLHSVTPSS